MADVLHSAQSIVGGHALAVASGAAGFLSGADKAKLDGVAAGADVTGTAKNLAYLNEITTGLTLGTSQPLSLADSIFTGKSAQATANLASGSPGIGIAAGAFASSGAETGTSATQGGLGSAAASGQPYNSTDFPGYRKARVLIVKLDDDQLTLGDVVPATTGADVDAPVYGYLTYRSDLGANLKWRLWFYYRRNSDGLEVPITPTASIANAKLYVVEVLSLGNLPGSALINRSIAGQLPGEMAFGAVGDIQALGVAAAGTSGKVADASHVHVMPRLDQVSAPTAAVALGSQKITGLANGTAASDGAAFGQIPLASSSTPAALGTAAVGAGTTWAKADHIHAMPSADQLSACAADVSLSSHKLTNVTDPSGAQDAATKNYVDTKIRQFCDWGATAAQGATSVFFLQAAAFGTASSAAEGISRHQAAFAGTIKQIYVSHAVANADSFIYTLRINGVDTAVTVTMAGSGTAASATGFSVAVAAGDVLSLKTVQSSTTAGASMVPRCAVAGTTP